MKKKMLVLGLAWLFFIVGTVNAQAYREIDRFTGETTIYSTKRRINLTRARALYFYVDAKEKGMRIKGCFQEWGHRRWKYLEYHDLVFLADGVPIIIDETEHKGDLDIFGNGKIGEFVYFKIRWTDFLKLLDADKVEYRLGTYERKFKKVEMKEMRSFRDEVLK